MSSNHNVGIGGSSSSSSSTSTPATANGGNYRRVVPKLGGPGNSAVTSVSKTNSGNNFFRKKISNSNSMSINSSTNNGTVTHHMVYSKASGPKISSSNSFLSDLREGNHQTAPPLLPTDSNDSDEESSSTSSTPVADSEISCDSELDAGGDAEMPISIGPVKKKTRGPPKHFEGNHSMLNDDDSDDKDSDDDDDDSDDPNSDEEELEEENESEDSVEKNNDDNNESDDPNDSYSSSSDEDMPEAQGPAFRFASIVSP